MGNRKRTTRDLQRILKAYGDAFACWRRLIESERLKKVEELRGWGEEERNRARDCLRSYEGISVCEALITLGLERQAARDAGTALPNGYSQEGLRKKTGISHVSTIRRVCGQLDVDEGLGLVHDEQWDPNSTHEYYPSTLLMTIYEQEVAPAIEAVLRRFPPSSSEDNAS